MSWEVDGKSEARIKAIAQALKSADRLILATDPDREGEAISWHISEELKRRNAIGGKPVSRVVFNEITKSAVLDAMKHPREVNRELVEAYLARRALDYLVGFTLSPVLWRKLPGSRSAGRVQSVALRLVWERESEIGAFRPREYWTIEVEFATEAGDRFTARLSHLDGKKLDRFDLDSEAKARAAADAILAAGGFNVASVEHREGRRNPFPPFTTSTLQQEASRKLGFGATPTMQGAQRLYEGIDLDGDTVGLITSMPSGRVRLHATGWVLVFDGFLKLYQEDRDDDPKSAGDEEGEGRRLPNMRERERLERGAVSPNQHFTQPPPRYSEASLVKKLEELGIGRPSTYASILQVLQDRDYVKLEKRRFIPEDRGRLVTAFLTSFFERYVEYNFTADLENQLDDVSGGRLDWKTVLRRFWDAFSVAVEGTSDLSIGQVIATLDEELGKHFFPDEGRGGTPRLCPACQNGRLSLKLGKYGAFIGCANYPECRYTRRLAIENGEAPEGDVGPKLLGEDPVSGLPVTLRKGPYGHYVQL